MLDLANGMLFRSRFSRNAYAGRALPDRFLCG